ncbi:MAG: Holliday junction resolvase RuvX [Ruminococcus sp.]|nr:Holliday junction resolvase RuvX [Ruminococcus sp.]
MIIISVDLGKARTGLAISDKTGFLASPLYTIDEKSPSRILKKVAKAVNDNNAQLIVVGLPKNMDGSEGESAQRCREFADSLSELTGVKTVMQDERGTTITAHGYLSARDVKGKKRKAQVDTVAAAIILQDYLDSNR